jgi:vanillate O-demethylase monooxygenase subunit
MENMLDTPHVPFVHSRSIGRGLRRRIDERMDVTWEARDFGAHISAQVEGEVRPGALDYRFPNAMELVLDSPKRLFRLMAICIPISDTETRLMLITLRSFLRSPFLDPLFWWMNRRIAEEDRAIVESSLPIFAPAPGEEASVRTDAATLAFRHLYRQRLLGSRAER